MLPGEGPGGGKYDGMTALEMIVAEIAKEGVAWGLEIKAQAEWVCAPSST